MNDVQLTPCGASMTQSFYGSTRVSGGAQVDGDVGEQVFPIGAQNLLNPTILQYYPPGIRATALGWALGVGRLGAVLGPVIGGLLLDANLALRLNFWVFAAVGTLAALAI